MEESSDSNVTIRKPASTDDAAAPDSTEDWVPEGWGDTKVTVKKPSEKAAAATEATAANVTIRKPGAEHSNGSSVTIRKPGDAAAGAEPKITVKKRAPSESADSPAPAASSEPSVTITVKKPTKTAAPAAAPPNEEDEMLVTGTRTGNSTLVLQALLKGANPNVRDPNGRTPLHFLAGLGCAPAMVLLVHYGADLDAPDLDGLTPIQLAAGYANPQSLRVLVSAGADYESAGARGKPYDIICAMGDFELSNTKSQRDIDKNEKLQKLKRCMDVLQDAENLSKTTDSEWDEMLTEVLKLVQEKEDAAKDETKDAAVPA